MEFDRVLIEQSIATQYGVLPSDQGELHYSDWAKLVGGLMHETPLGQMVALRSERDREAIKRFTPSQKRLRSEWAAYKSTRAAKQDAATSREQMNQLERMFAAMFAKGG